MSLLLKPTDILFSYSFWKCFQEYLGYIDHHIYVILWQLSTYKRVLESRPDQDQMFKKHPVDVFREGARWRAGCLKMLCCDTEMCQGSCSEPMRSFS